jgi:hypothetical protein
MSNRSDRYSEAEEAYQRALAEFIADERRVADARRRNWERRLVNVLRQWAAGSHGGLSDK